MFNALASLFFWLLQLILFKSFIDIYKCFINFAFIEEIVEFMLTFHHFLEIIHLLLYYIYFTFYTTNVSHMWLVFLAVFVFDLMQDLFLEVNVKHTRFELITILIYKPRKVIEVFMWWFLYIFSYLSWLLVIINNQWWFWLITLGQRLMRIVVDLYYVADLVRYYLKDFDLFCFVLFTEELLIEVSVF